MKNITSSYTFRSVGNNDMPLLSKWLQEPKVSRWFNDPDYVDSLKDNLEDSRIRMQLVLHHNEPMAYVQDYDIHAWTDHHLAYLPPESRGVDTFIGSDQLIGKGHGTNYLVLFSDLLFHDGVPAIGIDPHPDNVAARRVYEKIGFVENGIVESEWGKGFGQRRE
jgi:aminoglycoside 6'-N-acetyltransferase